jgi:hypothetical protein
VSVVNGHGDARARPLYPACAGGDALKRVRPVGHGGCVPVRQPAVKGAAGGRNDGIGVHAAGDLELDLGDAGGGSRTEELRARDRCVVGRNDDAGRGWWCVVDRDRDARARPLYPACAVWGRGTKTGDDSRDDFRCGQLVPRNVVSAPRHIGAT